MKILILKYEDIDGKIYFCPSMPNRDITIEELHPFKDHPFKIQSGEEMDKMIESIRKVGAITPALARPLEDGGFELISGHRRLAACQVLGLKTMPVIVREMTDDEAVIAMVDANLQTKTIADGATLMANTLLTFLRNTKNSAVRKSSKNLKSNLFTN